MFFPHFGAKTNITLKSAGARRQGGSAAQWGTATTSSDQSVLQSAASYWSVSYPSASRLQRNIVTAMCTILVTLKIIDIVQVLFYCYELFILAISNQSVFCKNVSLEFQVWVWRTASQLQKEPREAWKVTSSSHQGTSTGPRHRTKFKYFYFA